MRRSAEKVEISYHGLNSNRLQSRVIEPYAVYFVPDGVTLKLINLDALKSRLSVFSVDHIFHLKELDETFKRQSDFNLKTCSEENCFNGIHGAPVTVRLKAVGITARIFAERRFQPSQKTVEHKQRRGAAPESVANKTNRKNNLIPVFLKVALN